MPDQRLLIDADVFIQAKELYYRFDFCQGFWDWLIDAHHAGIVYSVRKVREELLRGNDDDDARKWALDAPDGFFLPDSTDNGVMAVYGQVMQWAINNAHYKDHAKAEFAKESSADAFLLAAAKHHGFDLVTQERSNPERKTRIMLPDAANALGVNPMFVYEMLSAYAEPTFKLKAAGAFEL